MNKYQAVIIGFGKAGKTLAVTLAILDVITTTPEPASRK